MRKTTILDISKSVIKTEENVSKYNFEKMVEQLTACEAKMIRYEEHIAKVDQLFEKKIEQFKESALNLISSQTSNHKTSEPDARLGEQVASQEKQIELLNEEIEKKNKEIEKLRKEVTTLHGEIKSKIECVNRVNVVYAKLETTNEEQMDKINASEVRTTDLEKQNRLLNEQNHMMTTI